MASPWFFRGGTPRPLSRAPRRGTGGEGPPDGSDVSFFQTMQSIRKWIEFSKISIFFFPKKSIFLRKNSKNGTNLTGIYEFFRRIIWKFSNFMKPINTEKFSVNSLIWLRNLQWRLKEFFRGERSGHLNSIKRPPQGVRGAKAPRMVAKFHFLKRFKVFENEFISQKCQHFSSSKYPFF